MMKKREVNMVIVGLFILYCLLASSGLILFKLGSSNSNLVLNIFGMQIHYSIKMILGLMCYAFSFVLWMYLVSKLNLTIAMPLNVAIVNTLVTVGSFLLLTEQVTPAQLIGIIVVIFGVCLITYKR